MITASIENHPIAPPASRTSFFESRTALWTGRVLSAIPIVLLAMDWGMKLVKAAPAVQGTVACGYPESAVVTIGVLGMICWILYVIPRTAILGAILWTGYLGGAIATHVRLGNPLLTHVLSPVYVAIFLWGGLWLRDRNLRNLVPLKRV